MNYGMLGSDGLFMFLIPIIENANPTKSPFFSTTFQDQKRILFRPQCQTNGRQTKMSSSAWQWSYLGWRCKNKSAVLPYEKASVCSLACVPTHVKTITVAVCLMGFIWSSQLNGRASSSSTQGGTAIILRRSKRWIQWHRQKDAGKQERPEPRAADMSNL